MRPHVLALVLGFAMVWPGRAAETSYPSLPLGAPAPDFNLPAVDGRQYQLKDFAKSKVLAVLFTCNHCPTAQELVTVSVNRPDEDKSVLAFLRKQQASNRNFIFASADRDKLIDAFDPDWQGAVPLTVLLSPEGKVLYREVGSIDSLAVKRAAVQAMNEKKPW